MQVTLTPHAEELLRNALACNPSRSPEEILEQALAEQANRNPVASSDPVWECLKSIPGIWLPDHWPPKFQDFEPIHVEGEPISEQLIRDRR